MKKEIVIDEEVKEVIERMANPTKPSDYGLSISYSSKKERDLIFKKLEEAKR